MIEFVEGSLFFGVAITMIGFLLGLTLKKRLGWRILHPQIFAIVFVILFLLVFRIDYAIYEQGAQYMTYLMTPATVCLAVPLYEQYAVLKGNRKAILIGCLAGAFSSLVGVFLLSALFRLSHMHYVTILPKSITAAIGMDIAQEYGGDPSMTATIILLTGMLGNLCADGVLRLLRIREPVAKGIAIGASAHAFGTVRALEMGEVEGAMSSLAIVVTGLLTVLFAPLFANLI